MGALRGVLGLVLATPLTACLLVLTRELYVKDRLETLEVSRTHAANGRGAVGGS